MYTVAPALARIRAIPFPIPREAPVTMHTFPVRDGSSEDAMLICYITRDMTVQQGVVEILFDSIIIIMATILFKRNKLSKSEH